VWLFKRLKLKMVVQQRIGGEKYIENCPCIYLTGVW
jgi:hypothetical protein